MLNIQEEVRKIVDMEQEGGAWADIVSMSDRLLGYIAREGIVSQVDGVIYQYLEDCDIRQADPVYADYQLANVRETLDRSGG